MIDRDHGEINFICDGKSCFESIETGERNWSQAIDVFKRHRPRWLLTQEGGQWKHYCEDCQNE